MNILGLSFGTINGKCDILTKEALYSAKEAVPEAEVRFINIEKWPDVETTEAVMKSETFRNFIPRLIPHFAGNKTLILHER